MSTPTAPPEPAPSNGPSRNGVPTQVMAVPLGPRTQAQLLALLERQAGALLVAALEAAGHDVADGWALRGELRLERVGSAEAPPAPAAREAGRT